MCLKFSPAGRKFGRCAIYSHRGAGAVHNPSPPRCKRNGNPRRNPRNPPNGTSLSERRGTALRAERREANALGSRLGSCGRQGGNRNRGILFVIIREYSRQFVLEKFFEHEFSRMKHEMARIMVVFTLPHSPSATMKSLKLAPSSESPGSSGKICGIDPGVGPVRPPGFSPGSPDPGPAPSNRRARPDSADSEPLRSLPGPGRTIPRCAGGASPLAPSVSSPGPLRSP
jgi:hypothetical protein